MMTFFVPGKPVGQGRITTINRHSFHSNAKELIPWRQTIAAYARAAKFPLLEGAISLSLDFLIVRPKTVKRDYPTVAPDLDHYVRAVGDALKGIAYFDDAQITDLSASKRYHDSPGVMIDIRSLTK